MSFLKNIGTYATKVAKNMSSKYSEKLLDSARKSSTDPIKTASKREIQKIAELTADLIGNKIADKTATVSKSRKEFHSKTDVNEVETPKKRYVSL